MKKSVSISEAQLERAALVFAALGEPSRLRLLRALMERPSRSVGELVGLTGFGQANVSKHLGILRQAGLVKHEREGNRVLYSLQGSVCEKLCVLVCGEIAREARLLA